MAVLCTLLLRYCLPIASLEGLCSEIHTLRVINLVDISEYRLAVVSIGLPSDCTSSAIGQWTLTQPHCLLLYPLVPLAYMCESGNIAYSVTHGNAEVSKSISLYSSSNNDK